MDDGDGNQNSYKLRSTMKSRLFWTFFVVIMLYLSVCAVVGVLVVERALHPSRNLVSATDETQAPSWARNNDDATLSDVAIVANDGVRLRAWEVWPDEPNGDEVILLHGLRGNRLEMVNYADLLLTRGYGVLMPDARAHGESGGSLATYGLLERDDIRAWFDWIEQRRHPDCVYGFGESMGAGQLLQSLASEKGFCAVAAECPFSSLRESFYDHIGQHFKTGPWLGRTILRPVVESAYLYARLRYKLDLDNISPEDAVAKTNVPVLLIHGLADTNIPVRHSRKIASENSSVVVWEIPNTGHSNAIDTSEAELDRRLGDWFHSHQSSPLN